MEVEEKLTNAGYKVNKWESLRMNKLTLKLFKLNFEDRISTVSKI